MHGVFHISGAFANQQGWGDERPANSCSPVGSQVHETVIPLHAALLKAMCEYYFLNVEHSDASLLANQRQWEEQLVLPNGYLSTTSLSHDA